MSGTTSKGKKTTMKSDKSLLAALPLLLLPVTAPCLDLGEAMSCGSNGFAVETGGRDPTVLEITRQFSKQCPSPLLSLIISMADEKKASGKESDSLYYSDQEGILAGTDPADDESPSLASRIFRKKDGSYLYMLTATMEMGGLYSDMSRFFSVDWQQGRITPLKDYAPENYPQPFRSNGTVTESHGAEKDGKVVISYEITDGMHMQFVSFFSWDGSTHTYQGSTIDLPRQKVLPRRITSKNIRFFAFADVDDDGNSELFLSTGDHETEIAVGIRSYEKKEQILLSRSGNSRFRLFEKGLAVEAGCGSGCATTDYVMLKDSRYLDRLNVYTLTPPDGSAPEVTYTLHTTGGEKELTPVQGEKFIREMGAEKKLNLDWQPLLKLDLS